MNLLFPALGGLGLLLLMGGKSSAATSSTAAKPVGPGGIVPKPGGKTALDFQPQIADALSRGDSDALMAIANEMQAAGLTEAAAGLRTVALNIKLLPPGILPSKAIPNPPIVLPTVVIPGSAPPLVVVPPLVTPSSVPLPAGVVVSSVDTQRMQVAQAMAVDLRNTSRYKENTVLVRRFQEQEGLVVDGLYGPKAGLAVANLGIIPPRPRYWHKATAKTDKQQYSADMLNRAIIDPTRAADWTAASKVQNDPIG